ncbi:MAG: transporter substrate-binding domain-containing protein [Gammaproteobacteria bacterium]|nr:transporter substrate-binding domain-containing protein [Gammaproteobacteria bacterium]
MTKEIAMTRSNGYVQRIKAHGFVGLRRLTQSISEAQARAMPTVHDQTTMLTYACLALVAELVVSACLMPTPQYGAPGRPRADFGVTRQHAIRVAVDGSPLAENLKALYYRSPSITGAPPWLYLETGDLGALKQRGKLRILAMREHKVKYPADDTRLADVEQQMIAEFADEVGLKPVWIDVDNPPNLIEFLLQGKGDLIAYTAPQSLTPNPEIAHTVPIARARYQLIIRADDHTIHRPADLSGRRVAMQDESPAWDAVKVLKTKYPTIKVETVPSYLSEETILERVASGQYDATVTTSTNLKTLLPARLNIKTAFDLTNDQPVAWATRSGAVDLIAALNKYLNQYQPARRIPEIYQDDLPALKERGILRVITRESPSNFFQFKGELLGFEYELVRRFAVQQKLRLEILVAPNNETALTWLNEGKGDIVAASLPIDNGNSDEPVAYSRIYNYSRYTVVGGAAESDLSGVNDLSDRQVIVPHRSPYLRSLQRLRDTGISVTLIEAPHEFTTKDIAERIAQGRRELAIVDSHELAIELRLRDDIKPLFPVGEPMPNGWAVRSGNEKLLDAVNDYLDKEYRSRFYNLTYQKYFKDPATAQQHLQLATERNTQLSPYDDFVKKYAEQYGFDWRLIVAQMYQESRFNPQALSRAGAQGLMQVLPKTASQLGYSDVRNPERGIRAGITYLHWLRDRFEPELVVHDRTWFALAAYNAGYGRIEDARRFAKELGLDPNRWFNNVERALYLLGRPQHMHRSRFRLCRCGETVDYVREIRARYHAYVHLTEPIQVASTSGQAPDGG